MIQHKRQVKLIHVLQALDVHDDYQISKKEWHAIYKIHPSSQLWRWISPKSAWEKKLDKKKFIVNSDKMHYFIRRIK